jgi:IS30 family transposase
MAKARFHEIARILKRQTSTIAREVRRNGGPEEYRSFYAQFRAQEYAKQRKKRRKLDSPPLLAKVPGHWEGDLIVGVRNASAIGTLVERTTRYTLIVKLHAKDAASVREAFEEKFNDLPPHLKRSLTYDQGQEMAEHKEFTKNSRIAVYFAHPHSPWERGTNENTNALIRDFLPKGTDFSKVSAEKLEYIQGLLNDRPRKVLQWLSPNEVISKLLH